MAQSGLTHLCLDEPKTGTIRQGWSFGIWTKGHQLGPVEASQLQPFAHMEQKLTMPALRLRAMTVRMGNFFAAHDSMQAI